METYQASELTLGMLGSVQKGDTVIFGSYSKSPGTAWVPMEWEVLRNEEGKLLLLSAYCIEAKPFHKAEAEAAADILFGDVNPSGKTAVTFVKTTGHIPLYYNATASALPT